MQTNKVFIVGTGEFAQIAYEYFTYDSDFEIVAFCVNKEYIKTATLYGLPVIPYEEIQERLPAGEYLAFTGIPASDMNRTRTRFYQDLKSMGYAFATYVSSRAFVWRNVSIGENSFIFEMNTLQPFVTVGNNCILWSGNHVGHRTVIQDNCFVASHAVISGYCEIGCGSFIGVNATFNDNVKIAENCLIGAAAHLTKDTEPERIYIGGPARPVPGKSSFDAGI
ncbi:sugar O-acyltransferase (sialic acid O-acetyltransferase NeuD family) [Chromobacterium alkanivorans]|uniref:acetyltransferase n=1 Tax=Chromobacterium alkanivorans TaxID=1071719 RepID=UPI002168302A|nr:acetyltransferase [Chromobacterium alkanivorans]MCS3802732.1 sugar O-acyltransferase (sialic acid O-acetyltransferase NeuD family) [Chromobacterium alkanivorans]MCS3817058.1 sugar O-acyltransferase (sialic acid O-acetyltransferase NeuD family) [Chromobacterium alkanivorans]MCS3872098.1 sugar O-acyltransferase (sialic acid O-acetyltransferase NeuD family) [Chromobacterium alkanivorans]